MTKAYLLKWLHLVALTHRSSYSFLLLLVSSLRRLARVSDCLATSGDHCEGLLIFSPQEIAKGTLMDYSYA